MAIPSGRLIPFRYFFLHLTQPSSRISIRIGAAVGQSGNTGLAVLPCGAIGAAGNAMQNSITTAGDIDGE
ncbi:hypothetical protein GX441_01950 [bacterium]|nr:hypothetical protein [bacterium]